MLTRQRRITHAIAATAVLVSAGVVITAAVSAEGRTAARADTNDGGAWLVKRDEGLVGHLNRAAGEVTGRVRVAAAGSEIDVEQAGDAVVVHDRTVSTLVAVEPRSFQVLNTIGVGRSTRVTSAGDDIVLWEPDPLTIWRIATDRLGDVARLDELAPTYESTGAGLVTASTDGTIWATDAAEGSVVALAPGASDVEVFEFPQADAAVAISSVADEALVQLPGSVVVVPGDGDEPGLAAPSDLVLAQPHEGAEIVGVDASGVVHRSVDGSLVGTDDIGGRSPVAPILHDGCLFAVVTEPPTFFRRCGDAAPRVTVLEGAGSALRLRLVNGWVWINDLDSGTTWVTDVDGDLDRLDEWGADLGDDAGDGDQSDQDGSTEQQENPDSDDAEFEQADEIDEDGVNDPPVARDDEVRTRLDATVVVDVLANDDDPDGDVILVDDVVVSGDLLAAPTADRRAVQVQPPPGFVGRTGFTYSISDGRGGVDTAEVSIEILPDDGSANLPPVTTTDIAEARAGAAAVVNVLTNDRDPDGDPIVLRSVVDESGGRVAYDASGQVTFTPAPASAAGTTELTYVAVDTFGAESQGTLRVEVRLDSANNEPDARNDAGRTVVGKPITLDVLLNDTDPDNDPLSIAAPPEPVVPASIDASTTTVSLSPDGELFFVSETAGTHIVRYRVIDGSESDVATVRIEVDAATENRPPIAVRDDIAVSRGGTATVYVLQNDADPDGDVVVLSSWRGTEGLTIEEVRGLGFRVTVDPDAPSQLSFRYAITDGMSEPVWSTVVVAVSDALVVDQPPVARPDVVEIRPGRTVGVAVLVNDYDPEGSPLTVVAVADVPAGSARIGPGGQEVFVTLDDDVISGFTFGYDVIDDGGNRSASFVRVEVVPEGEANRPPVARTDVARTRAGDAVDVPVLLNDSDPDGDPIRVESIAAQPALGIAELLADGTIRYTAGIDAAGTDRIRYVVVDALGGRTVGDVLVGVIRPGTENSPPTAADDSFTLQVGGDPVVLDVLANDWDADADQLRITTVASSSGDVALDDSGTALTYRPPAEIDGESLQVTAVYGVADGRGGDDDAVVTITVVQALEPVAPIAVDDVVGPVRPGGVVVVDPLANDIDPDGSRLSLVLSSDDPAIRTIDTGGVELTAGTATSVHRYTITDGDGLASSATVTIIVADNVAPVVGVLSLTTPHATPISVVVSDAASDADPEDVLYFACCDQVSGGTAIVTESAGDRLVVDFTPDTDFAGTATFTYTVDDQQGHVVAGAVTITVTPPENRPPDAIDGTGSVEAGTTGTVSLGPLASDPDSTTGDSLVFSLVDAPEGVSGDGDAIRVVAPIDAAGQQRVVRFRVTDRTGAADEATVIVTITPSSAPPPSAIADVGRTNQGEAVTIDVLANDVDHLGLGLRITNAAVTAGNGTVAIGGADGRSLVVQPSPDYFGALQVQYEIVDARSSADGTSVGQLTIDVIGRPDAPSVPTATASNATAAVAWGQPAANGSPIADIEIESDQVPVRSIGVVSSYTYTDLANGVAHRFRVRARNEAGWGPWSEWSAAVTPDVQPGRPLAPSVTFGDGELTVTWSEPANEGSAITGYDLEIGGGDSSVRTLGAQTTYVWTGLENGVSHQFRVVAVNAAGRSEPSAWSPAERPLREPDAPSTPAVTQGNRYLDLVWTPPADNGDPISGYEIEMQSQPGVFVPVVGTSHRWTNLTNGVEQSFRVRARNRDPDWGAWSGWSTPVRPCGPPDAPAAPSAVRGDQQATVTWTAPDPQGCEIVQYEVQTDAGATQATTATNHVFGGLANGTPVSFRVRALNSVGWGEWSPLSAAVVPAGAPIGPASMSATPVAPGTVDLAWSAANPNGAAVANYQVAVNGGAPRDVGNVTSYRWVGLANSTEYGFQVRACNEVGCGPYSAVAVARTWGAPSQPNPPNLSVSGRTISASWSAPATNGSPITRYDVEISPGSEKSVTTRSTSWSNLEYDTTYSVRVQACNAVGCGYWSSWSSTVIERPVSVVASKGATINNTSCSHSSCRWINVSASGLQPNRDYTVGCRTSSDAWGDDVVRSNGSGQLSHQVCYYGYPNTNVWVVVGPYRSNTITW